MIAARGRLQLQFQAGAARLHEMVFGVGARRRARAEQQQ